MFHYFNAGKADDLLNLAQLRPDLDDFLQHVYGSSYRGIEHLFKRIYTRKSHVWIAQAPNEPITGLTYVRPSGKRDGTCVRDSHRRSGLAQQLLRASLRLLPNQFSVVFHSNTPIIRLYQTNGFRFATTVNQVSTLLDSIEFEDTRNHRVVNDALEFDRINRHISQMEYDFVCMLNYAPTDNTGEF